MAAPYRPNLTPLLLPDEASLMTDTNENPETETPDEAAPTQTAEPEPELDGSSFEASNGEGQDQNHFQGQGGQDTVTADGEDEVAADDQDEVADDDTSVEALIVDLERVTAERDQYLDTSRRVQAEFENYRKQVAKREADARERANETMVNELLPVLDAFDGAISSGIDDVNPMRVTMLDALAKQGLERIDPQATDEGEAPFDPNLHEAVMHEAADGGNGPVVAEVLRAGYAWKGRVVRPAMVKVRG